MVKDNIQPVFIMPEGAKQNTGKTAQKNNISAAKLVAETIRTTLGPKGMDKMLVNSMNEITVTNDGVTILEEMELEHPIAKMIVEVAKTQETEVGDGTTTAVILAGELLKAAESLLNRGIHPTVLTKGYRLAAKKSLEILDAVSKKIDLSDELLLEKIVKTAMTGKGAEVSKDILAKIVVKAVLKVSNSKGSNKTDIKVEKRVGSDVDGSELLLGLIIDKDRVHPDMPEIIENPKIALLNCPLEIKDTETDAKISITDPMQMQAFLDQEETMIKTMVEKVVLSGANFVVCQKGIDDLAQYFLAKKGILACRRVRQSDLKRLAKATGAKVVFDIHDLSSEKLGTAKQVCEKQVGFENMLYVEGCKEDNVATILVSGGTDHVAEETRRAVEDAIGDLFSVIKSKKVVFGAGAVDIELSRNLLKYAKTLSGREQLAVKSFAEALEIVPRTLAENAGLDPIDVVAELNAAHEAGNTLSGINVFTGKLMNSWEEGIIEPINVKLQAIRSASEVANMILRIDDVIATSPEPPQREGGPQVNFPPGMGY